MYISYTVGREEHFLSADQRWLFDCITM